MQLVQGRIVSDGGGRRGRKAALPPVPLTGDQAQNRFNNAVAEAVQQLTGGPDRAVTVSELPAAVAANAPAPEADTRVPPAPVGLEGAGAFRNIMLSWDYPPYDYHAFTRIFRATVDDFEQSAVIANTEAKFYADTVGNDQGFYYWVANVSKGGIQSAPNGVSGTYARTQPDINYLLDTLEGEILRSSLTSALQGDIAQLEGQMTLKVDGNGRVAGIGLASSNAQSQIVMLADQFSVVIPGTAGSAPVVPFVVGTVNGTPAVVMRNTLIADAAITNAMIGNAVIDDAKIANLSATKITFGTMSGARIDVNSLNADRIITSTLTTKLASITDAYIVNAHITDLTLGTEKFTPNAMSNCAYMQIANGGDGGNFPATAWADFDTTVSGGSNAVGGTGSGVVGGGTGGGGRYPRMPGEPAS